MDWVWPVIQSPFIWGLALGLLVAGFSAKSAWTARGGFKREITRQKAELEQLQQHLNTHLKITATGSDRLEKELAELKTQNENLRVNLATSQQRPGRAEARQLQIYEAAIARMREQAPGFASAWEQSLRLAAAENEAAENGFTRLVRKIIPGTALPSGPAESTPLIGGPDSAKSSG